MCSLGTAAVRSPSTVEVPRRLSCCTAVPRICFQRSARRRVSRHAFVCRVSVAGGPLAYFVGPEISTHLELTLVVCSLLDAQKGQVNETSPRELCLDVRYAPNASLQYPGALPFRPRCCPTVDPYGLVYRLFTRRSARQPARRATAC